MNSGNIQAFTILRSLFVTAVTLVVIILLFVGQAGADKVVAIFPFEDDSGYRGPWDLTNGLPVALGEQLASDYFIVIPYDTVKSAIQRRKRRKDYSEGCGLLSPTRGKY